MGRPTKYTEDMPQLVGAYVEGHVDEGDVLPTVEGLALYLDVSKETVYAWSREESKADFSDALERLKLVQFKKLFSGALRGELNTAIAKMTLNSNHGMIERKAQEISGPDGGPVAITETRVVLVDPDAS